MSKRDEPNCDHGPMEVMVSNQTGDFDRTRPLRSVWVCGQRACVIDAMAWVERGTGKQAWWRVGVASNGNPWRNDMPEVAA